jgi:cell shape-determining protein MreD
MDWYQVKESIELFTGLDMDALHVHVGILAQIGVALLMRRTLGSPWPWLVVLAAAIGNEYYDLAYETWPEPERERQFMESVRDVWNTMLMPTLLLLLCRFAPRLFVRPALAEETPV